MSNEASSISTKKNRRFSSDEANKIRLRNMIHRMINSQVDMATIQKSVGLSHACVMRLLADQT